MVNLVLDQKVLFIVAAKPSVALDAETIISFGQPNRRTPTNLANITKVRLQLNTIIIWRACKCKFAPSPLASRPDVDPLESTIQRLYPQLFVSIRADSLSLSCRLNLLKFDA